MPPLVSASATVTATVVDRGIPCRSGKAFCAREPPSIASADGGTTLAAFLAARSTVSPLAWTARWAGTDIAPRRRPTGDTLTVLLIY